MTTLIERFLRYVSFDTQSDHTLATCPSTPGQTVFAKQLQQELIALNLDDVKLDSNGYLTARLPSNISTTVPTIGFIAHMDTAPDASGQHVKPQIVENYQGGDIRLSDTEKLSPAMYPELEQLQGQTLITTDGSTLLGGDNKAGIAEIITAIAYLQANPEIEHGDICIGFTPDEEIGRGADLFDVKGFNAQWAYTIDGGPVGELEYENFNASSADVICRGVNVHPGSAKGKMVNSMGMAAKFQMLMPADETPECTGGYQGFYHLNAMQTSVAKTTLSYIIRDFDQTGLAHRKAFMQQKVAELNNELGCERIEIKISDSYNNMREMVEPHVHIIELATHAMIECDIQPDIKPIRGGTDGARLSFMGLPCPNIFTGGYNFHGIHEFITVEGMEKSVQVIVKLAALTAKKYQ
ncbi:peptidase T [Moritella sp. Urea-trap-13]|uniref:peptidase T n=1 Tax=Moritella sp. Urea-trap-13 TaxID=2058327 RepID=UPI000C321EB6|nr:peptidase T [Moritella sp. Urea-trap-13]PKH06600.1 peptidase T [Moritella sp. Urea-trap-13]